MGGRYFNIFRVKFTCVLAVEPWDDVDPLEGEFGCKWWAQLPFSLSLSLRPTKDGLGMCQESGLAAATAVVVATAVVSIWNRRKSTWSFDCISDNAMPIAPLLFCPHVPHLRSRVVYLSPENIIPSDNAHLNGKLLRRR